LWIFAIFSTDESAHISLIFLEQGSLLVFRVPLEKDEQATALLHKQVCNAVL
jgi:hypothetical protein